MHSNNPIELVRGKGKKFKVCIHNAVPLTLVLIHDVVDLMNCKILIFFQIVGLDQFNLKFVIVFNTIYIMFANFQIVLLTILFDIAVGQIYPYEIKYESVAIHPSNY